LGLKRRSLSTFNVMSVSFELKRHYYTIVERQTDTGSTGVRDASGLLSKIPEDKTFWISVIIVFTQAAALTISKNLTFGLIQRA
jgi:hypothetical protein